MCSIRCFSVVILAAALSPAAAFAQNTSASRNDSVISVQELGLPGKATRAFQKGTQLLMKGDAQASLAYFYVAIDQAPSFSRAYHNLALAYYKLGRLDDASDNFQKAIDLTNGSFAPSFFGLSMVLYRQRDFRHAETIIQNGLLLQPGSVVGKYCLGLVQYSLGRLVEAERSARDALWRNPAEADPYLLLAQIHERQSNPDAVIAEVQTYLKLDPHGLRHDEALGLLRRAQQQISPTSSSLR
jgi:protein O-GlcNAc transferase